MIIQLYRININSYIYVNVLVYRININSYNVSYSKINL